MSNDYYNAPVVPVDYTLARADQIRQQLAAVAGGFDKLPLPQDLHENRIGFVVAEGTANAITVELTAAPLSYEDGMTLKLGITATNTGPATINVNGLGVVPIVGRLINPLTAGDLVVGTVETMIYYAGKFIIREVSGAQGPQGEIGPEGPLNGRTILNGAVVPTTEGDDGDFYIRTGVWTIYGPKTAGAWGAATDIIGPAGPDGNDGADGADGKTVLNGAGAPAGGTGVDGDFYIDTTADAIYGPKTAGAWGAGTSLIGPPGADGTDGIDGSGGDWADLTSRPAALLALAGLSGDVGKIPYFTNTSEDMSLGTILEIINALSAGDKGVLAGYLGAVRIESMSLVNPGYIRFQLPDGSFAIFQWGTQVFAANGNTTVNYPCPTDYTSFSVAVVSSARSITNAQDNCAQTVSCGLDSFIAYSANDNVLPGFWLAWGV